MTAVSAKPLTMFSLIMINLAVVGSIKNWPVLAEYGFSSIFFFLLATILFFIPTSLVSAELASGWPKTGGVFVWVKEAFGHRTGFLAAWLLWVQNVIWFPTTLSFIAVALSYLFNPLLAANKLYNLILVLFLVWATTLANFRGMRTSSWISTVGVLFGTFIPGGLIIVLGAIWLMQGRPLEISFSWESLSIDLGSLDKWIFFAGVLLSLAGMEMSAVHAKEVGHPQKNYPRAIVFSAVTIFILSLLGVLSIAFVIPQKEINLVAGSLQAFAVFLDEFHLKWMLPCIAALVGVGAWGSMSTWLAGPSKALLGAAQSGDLPPHFRKINTHRMPQNMLIAQGVIISILALLFVLLPSLNVAYWLMIALNSLLYLLMYLFLFATAIKLRYKRPQVERPYKIPGGKIGIWFIAGVGFFTSLAVFVLAFFPPKEILQIDPLLYVLFLAAGVLLVVAAPYLILLFKRPEWCKPLPHERE